MKAVVLHEYGGPAKLKWEEFDDPKPGKGEVLVRVHAVSVNPIDWKMRSGAAKERFPLTLPSILGRDVAGLVQELGEGVTGFAVGDRVMALATKSYAELCVVKAEDLAKIPEGIEMTTAGAVPLVALTGDQLIRKATQVEPGQTILLAGAVGSVGRMALFCALEIGAKVIAGVRRKQKDEARALGAVEAIDIDDKDELAKLGLVDGVADAVGGEIATSLLGKVKPGGIYGSVLGQPKGAELHPTVVVSAIMAQSDADTVAHYAEAIRDGRMALPIERLIAMADAAEAHTIAEKGGVGKIVLVA